MARRTTAKKAAPAAAPGRPRKQPLPGMEDRAIAALEDLAVKYAGIRDQRMELNRQEHALKLEGIKLLKKYGKTFYKHDGVEILLVAGEDDIKVKVKKVVDDDEAEDEAGDDTDSREARESLEE